MPDLTPANRDRARRALVAAGYPIADDVDGLERIRRTELLEAVATVDAIAERRGRVAADLDVYRQGLGQAFSEALAVLDAPDPEATIRNLAAGYGVDRDLDGPPEGVALDLLRSIGDSERPLGGPLDTDEPQSDEDLCAHPDGYGDPDPIDGLRRCRSGCSDVVVGGLEVRDGVVVQGNARVAALQRLAGDEDTAAERRADRMTWTPGDLQITPPKACGAMPPADETLREKVEALRRGSDTAMRCLDRALDAMNRAVAMTTEEGPAVAIEFIADFLNDSDGIDEDVADNAPDDWLTRWTVTRAVLGGSR